MNRIIQGNSLEVLKTLPDESVDCVVTSPPYWALRDYGVEGQLGLEPTFQDYITKLCDIFDEVRRVLKKDGTCWVNLGDTYFGSGKGAGGDGSQKESWTWTEKEKRICQNCGKEFIGRKFQNFCGSACSGVDNTKRKLKGKLEDKTLCQIPSRFAIEMTNRGWILRNKIIWHKPNAMPSSAKDRFTVDFEEVFFFVKNKRYYFETQYETLKTFENRPSGMKRTREWGYDTKYEGIHLEKKVRQGMHKERGSNLIEKRNLPEHKIFVDVLRENFSINELVEKTGLKETQVAHWFRYDDVGFSYPTRQDWEKVGTDLFPEISNIPEYEEEFKPLKENLSILYDKLKKNEGLPDFFKQYEQQTNFDSRFRFGIKEISQKDFDSLINYFKSHKNKFKEDYAYVLWQLDKYNGFDDGVSSYWHVGDDNKFHQNEAGEDQTLNSYAEVIKDFYGI